jgi:hypothetical protein
LTLGNQTLSASFLGLSAARPFRAPQQQRVIHAGSRTPCATRPAPAPTAPPGELQSDPRHSKRMSGLHRFLTERRPHLPRKGARPDGQSAARSQRTLPSQPRRSARIHATSTRTFENFNSVVPEDIARIRPRRALEWPSAYARDAWRRGQGNTVRPARRDRPIVHDQPGDGSNFVIRLRLSRLVLGRPTGSMFSGLKRTHSHAAVPSRSSPYQGIG